MRRADRLFEIVQYLRGRRLTTAAQLAQWLEVSERTIYRDIADLCASGVPIDGEAGVGYRIASSFDLPPLMFSFDEIDALVAGARFVEAWGGPGLAGAARSALAKIAAALPPEKRAALEDARLFAPNFFIDPKPGERLESLRQAIGARHIVQLDYRDANGAATLRRVRPLGIFFWGNHWSLAAWCELRQDFRNFRLERIAELTKLDERFVDEPGRGLADFFRAVEQ
ncbi:MAG TPA: YafY family protein [Burkholderiaceae bacterium]|nr:YafY family protein [Burkholderiaceae bacterium]